MVNRGVPEGPLSSLEQSFSTGVPFGSLPGCCKHGPNLSRMSVMSGHGAEGEAASTIIINDVLEQDVQRHSLLWSWGLAHSHHGNI